MATLDTDRQLLKTKRWRKKAVSFLSKLYDAVGTRKRARDFEAPPNQHDAGLTDTTDGSAKCGSDEQLPEIQVTIRLSWNTDAITRSPPQPYTTTVLQGTVLRTLLDEAALVDHSYSYTTDYIRGLGDQLISIGGLGQDSSDRLYWMTYEKPGHLTLSTIDEFQPKNGSTTTLQLFIIESPKLRIKTS